MKPIIRSIVLATMILACTGVGSMAQSPADHEKQVKQMYEAIDKEIDRLTDLLELDDAQIFYVDSIMTHDYQAWQDELNELNQKKVTNTDIYYQVQYKWQEQMYNSYQKVFTAEQWEKYLKSGAARAKKTRDKKMQK